MALDEKSLTTIATVKAELSISITDTTYDALLERYINEVSDAFVQICGRTFHYKAGVVEKLVGYGTTNLVLSRTPIVSVASISINGGVLDPTEYEVSDAEAGLVYRSAGWPRSHMLSAGIAYDPYPGSEKRSIMVTYTGGYVTPEQNRITPSLTITLPSSLEGLCIEGVVTKFRDRGVNKAITSEKLLGGIGAEYKRGKYGLPLDLIDTLEKNWSRLAQA